MNYAKSRFCDGILYAPVEADRSIICGNGIERHSVCEAFLMLNGSCSYVLNGREITFHKGDSCLILPWIPHLFGFKKDFLQCDQLWLHPTSSFFVYIHHNTENYSYSRKGRIPQEYVLLFQQLIKDYKEEQDPAELKAFFDLFSLKAEKIHLHLEEKKPNLSETVKLIIQNRNGVNCSLEELEKYTGYSRSHIAHTFRKECGFSVGDYINMVRQEFTEEALAFGMKQKEIAATLGFSSPSAFWQWYRKFR